MQVRLASKTGLAVHGQSVALVCERSYVRLYDYSAPATSQEEEGTTTTTTATAPPNNNTSANTATGAEGEQGTTTTNNATDAAAPGGEPNPTLTATPTAADGMEDVEGVAQGDPTPTATPSPNNNNSSANAATTTAADGEPTPTTATPSPNTATTTTTTDGEQPGQQAQQPTPSQPARLSFVTELRLPAELAATTQLQPKVALSERWLLVEATVQGAPAANGNNTASHRVAAWDRQTGTFIPTLLSGVTADISLACLHGDRAIVYHSGEFVNVFSMSTLTFVQSMRVPSLAIMDAHVSRDGSVVGVVWRNSSSRVQTAGAGREQIGSINCSVYALRNVHAWDLNPPLRTFPLSPRAGDPFPNPSLVSASMSADTICVNDSNDKSRLRFYDWASPTNTPATAARDKVEGSVCVGPRLPLCFDIQCKVDRDDSGMFEEGEESALVRGVYVSGRRVLVMYDEGGDEEVTLAVRPYLYTVDEVPQPQPQQEGEEGEKEEGQGEGDVLNEGDDDSDGEGDGDE